jgi:hypothetical protein
MLGLRGSAALPHERHSCDGHSGDGHRPPLQGEKAGRKNSACGAAADATRTVALAKEPTALSEQLCIQILSLKSWWGILAGQNEPKWVRFKVC